LPSQSSTKTSNSSVTSNNTPSDAPQKTAQGSRRDFLKTGTTVAATAAAISASSTPTLSLAKSAHAAGSDTVRIGLVGCGGRGAGAAIQAMNTTSGNVELVAVADVFADRLQSTVEQAKTEHGEKVRVNVDTSYIGFDAYKSVMDSDADLVILATPPGFRPLHFEAAVNAGKHVFMEKPVAVDAPGIRKVLEFGKVAEEKNLLVQVGLQRRHERAYMETIDQLQNGIIGDLIYSQVYWNSNGVWERPRKPGDTELTYQMRNWYYFNWLCGDHIVEQHIHNIDVINWMMDGFPVKAQGQGGRLLRNGVDHGQIFDHHFVEYTYANGHKMFSQCRHMRRCYKQVSEHVVGTKGYADVSTGTIYSPDGKEIFKCAEGPGTRLGHQQEHHDLFANLAQGILPNESEYGAKSTMTAILGRLATYSGLELNWDDAINSNVSLAENLEALETFESEAPVQPDAKGKYPVARPGIGADKIIDWEVKRSAKKKPKSKPKKATPK
jgi:predicted dehydrogenase